MISTKREPSILVLDSGVGGLSVCEAILDRVSDINITYIADDAAFPYGLKGDAFLLARLSKLIHLCLQVQTHDLVVLACNTISTLLLPALREEFNVPFVGVVPAIKPAAASSQNKVLGLLATPGTITRPYIDRLVGEFAAGVSVVRLGSKVLVEQAEGLLLHGEVELSQIKRELEPYIAMGEQGPDTIVLGCTHFPFLKQQISELLPGANLVDSGDAIARRVSDLLRLDQRGERKGRRHQIFFTGQIKDTALFRDTLEAMGFGAPHIELLDLSEIRS